MRHKVRLVALSLLACLLTGCWDRTEVEDLLFPVTVAVDKGERRKYRVTMRVPISAAMRAGVLGGLQGAPAQTAEFIGAEADSISQAVYILNASVARRITIRHLRGVVIGEELARDGIGELLAELMRNGEARQTAGIFIARGKAGETLRSSQPTGEVNPGKISEGVLLVEKQLHMAPPTRLHHMTNRGGIIGVDPFAPIVAINLRATGAGGGASGDTAIAGQLDRSGESPVEIAGTALFRDTRLVGFLSVDQTQALLALRGEMGKAYITIPNPIRPGESLMIRFHQENLPQFHTWFERGKPRVTVRLIFEGEVLSGTKNYRNDAIRRRVEAAARTYMEVRIQQVLQRTAEWGVDPMGFGLLFRTKFLTWEEWVQYDWHRRVPELKVQVQADMRIRRFGLVMGMDSLTEGR